MSIVRTNSPFGEVCIGGTELYKHGFLLIHGYAYTKFTERGVPKRISLSWDEERKSLTLKPATDDDTDSSVAFTDESSQSKYPKPRARIRARIIFRRLGIPWPTGSLETATIRIPFKVSPSKLEMFIGLAFDHLSKDDVEDEVEDLPVRDVA